MARRGGRPARPTLGYTGQAAATLAAKANDTGALNTGAGFILGVIADVLFINYLRGGWPQVKRWLSAKVLNRVAGKTFERGGPLLNAPPPGQAPGSTGPTRAA